ncbi:MAG TPA: HD domain-containing protein [Gemmatimonadales bacterium]|nr:HD domain-containing protein [Gemmatimonadales bacterium]
MATTDISPDSPVITQRFLAALTLALDVHRLQFRKGTTIPYASHLLAVVALVLEYGGTENQAIAAALHDAVEDQGGPSLQQRIWQQFGPDVARLVESLTDAESTPKPPWRERKERYVQRLARAPEDALLVDLACKVHNARTIVADLRTDGAKAWERTGGGREGSLWYYRALVDAIGARTSGRLVDELRRLVGEMERAG